MLLPVPVDRLINDIDPQRYQITVPTINAPQQIMALIPQLAIIAATNIYTTRQESYIRIFTYNLMSSNNWNNESFIELLTFLVKYYILNMQFSGGNITANLIQGGVPLYISHLVEKYPELNNVLDQQTLAAANNNLPDYYRVLSSANNVGQQMPNQQPNYGGMPNQQSDYNNAPNLAAGGNNLYGGAPFNSNANVVQPQMGGSNVSISMLDNEHSVDTPYRQTDNAVSMFGRTEETPKTTVDAGHVKKQTVPVSDSQSIPYPDIPFYKGEEYPPLLPLRATRSITTKDNYKIWRIDVDKTDHEILKPFKQSALEDTLQREYDLNKQTSKEELLEFKGRDLDTSSISLSISNETDINLCIEDMAHVMMGSTKITMINALIHNEIVVQNECIPVDDTEDDLFGLFSKPNDLLTINKNIREVLSRTAKVVQVTKSIDAIFTDIVNTMLRLRLNSPLFIDSFVLDFNEELVRVLMTSLPEVKFREFMEWNNTIINTILGGKINNSELAEYGFLPIDIFTNKLVMLPMRKQYIVLDLSMFNINVTDLNTVYGESNIKRIDTRTNADLYYKLKPIIEKIFSPAPLYIVDVSTEEFKYTRVYLNSDSGEIILSVV